VPGSRWAAAPRSEDGGPHTVGVEVGDDADGRRRVGRLAKATVGAGVDEGERQRRHLDEIGFEERDQRGGVVGPPRVLRQTGQPARQPRPEPPRLIGEQAAERVCPRGWSDPGGFLAPKYVGGEVTTFYVPGGFYGTAGTQHGFVFERGRYRTIAFPGRTENTAFGINDRGEIVVPQPTTRLITVGPD
jgi:hypothetical protein